MTKEGLHLHSGGSCWYPNNSVKRKTLPLAHSEDPSQSHDYKLKYVSQLCDQCDEKFDTET